MNKLLYHSPNSSLLTSPFDDAVLQVAYQNSVKIVSPYIGIGYLQRIICICEDWIIISDVEAWLSSLSFKERVKAWAFIRSNIKRIHHFPDIHAKTVIAPNIALIGSANLTSMGILGRTEMGILLKDHDLVLELNEWFDVLWKQTEPPVVDEANAYVQWLDQQAITLFPDNKKRSISSSGLRIRSHLASISNLIKSESTLILDLNAAARSLVNDEQRKIETLEEIVIIVIDALAPHGFTLKEFLDRVNASIKNISLRETYLALLSYCANNARSVFKLNTTNRLLRVGDRFIGSTASLLYRHISPFDKYLCLLINNLDFNLFKKLPSKYQIKKLIEIKESHQTWLLETLESIYFIELKDQPEGDIFYRLREDFEWSSRFQLFTLAYEKWNDAVKNVRVKIVNTTTNLESIELKKINERAKYLEARVVPLPSQIQSTKIVALKKNVFSSDESSTNKVIDNYINSDDKLISSFFVATKQNMDAADHLYWVLGRMLGDRGSYQRISSFDSLVEHLQEKCVGLHLLKSFIASILQGKIEGIPKVFLIAFNKDLGPRKQCRIYLIAGKAKKSNLPMTSRLIEEYQSAGKLVLAEYSKSNDRKIVIVNLDAPVASTPINDKEDGLKVISRIDKVYSTLVSSICEFGNPLPFNNSEELLIYLARANKTSMSGIERILLKGGGGIPDLFSIDLDRFKANHCYVYLHHVSEEVMKQLPRTKALLEKIPKEDWPTLR